MVCDIRCEDKPKKPTMKLAPETTAHLPQWLLWMAWVQELRDMGSLAFCSKKTRQQQQDNNNNNTSLCVVTGQLVDFKNFGLDTKLMDTRRKYFFDENISLVPLGRLLLDCGCVTANALD